MPYTIEDYAVLRITDGTYNSSGLPNEINLLTGTGFQMGEWRPAITSPKGGGVWADSEITDGSRQIFQAFERVDENMTIFIIREDQDALIADRNLLRKYMHQAVTASVNPAIADPVWLEARAHCESDTRYAWIVGWGTPQDADPYNEPFFAKIDDPAEIDMDLIITREPFWRSHPPQTGECVPLAPPSNYCWPPHIEFDGDVTEVDCGSSAGLDDLPDNAVAGKGVLVVDGWVRPDGFGELNSGRIFDKTRWNLLISGTQGLWSEIQCAGTSALSRSGLDDFTADGEWHHVMMAYDETGGVTPAARTIYFAIDGIWVTSYATQQVSVGNYVSDAANNLIMGNNAGGVVGWDGGIGWIRINDAQLPSGIQVNVDFDDDLPPRCVLPAIETGVVAQWIGTENTGTTIYNQEGTGGRDGTLTAGGGGFDCDCQTYPGYQQGPAYTHFNALTTEIRCGSDASIDNLPDNAVSGKGVLVADAWVRADGWGEGGGGRIFDKTFWNFLNSTGSGLISTVSCAATNAQSITGTDDWTPDSTWHHVMIAYDETGGITPAARTIYIAVDGDWITSYTTQTASVGNYTVDTAANLFVGNTGAANRTWDGDIGWARLSNALPTDADGNTIVVNTDFTPAPRCALPAVQAGTLMLNNYEGWGTTTYDISGNGNDGTITDGLWGNDCPIYPTTCDSDRIYVANKQIQAHITHIFWYDTGTASYSANLKDTVAAALLPTLPANGDYLYLGSDVLDADSGPFSSVVFNLLQAGAGYTAQWEYWNGAWVALTNFTDGPDELRQAGRTVLSYQNPSAWTTNTINGVTAWWIRLNITGAGTAVPVQHENRIYTVNQGFFEIQSTDVIGDVDLFLRSNLFNISTSNLARQGGEVIIGRRELTRGENFSAYLNAGDEQQLDGITQSLGGSSSYVTQARAPTGRATRIAVAGAANNVFTQTWILSSTLAPEFYGRYRAYARVYDISNISNITWYLAIRTGIYGARIYSARTDNTSSVAPSAFLDFGEIELPGTPLNSSEQAEELRISVVIDHLNNATAELFDVILIPVDEGVWDTQILAAVVTNPTYHIQLDSVSYLFRPVRSTIRDSADLVSGRRLVIGGSPHSAQARKGQRYWVFARYEASNERADHETVHAVQTDGLARYWSARGDDPWPTADDA